MYWVSCEHEVSDNVRAVLMISWAFNVSSREANHNNRLCFLTIWVVQISFSVFDFWSYRTVQIDRFTLFKGALWVSQGKFTKKQSRKTNVFLYISVLISHLVTKQMYTTGGAIPILGLPAFLSRSSECCGRTNLFYSQNRMIRSSLSRSIYKITSPLL